MKTFDVVNGFNECPDVLPGFGFGGIFVEIHFFGFESFHKAFDLCVVMRIAFATHADGNTVVGEPAIRRTFAYR